MTRKSLRNRVRTMKRKRNLLWTALLLTAALTLGEGPDMAKAQAPGSSGLATAQLSSGRIDWTPGIPNNGVELSIGGNNFNFAATFAVGQEPKFDLSEVQGGSLPNGVYKWELTFSPPGPPPVNDGSNGRHGSSKKALTGSDGSLVPQGNGRGRGMVASGAFTVSNGSIVDSGLPEPTQSPE